MLPGIAATISRYHEYYSLDKAPHIALTLLRFASCLANSFPAMERSQHRRQRRNNRKHHLRSPSPGTSVELNRAPPDRSHSRHFPHAPQTELESSSIVQSWLQHTEFPGQAEQRGLTGRLISNSTAHGYRRPPSTDSSFIVPVVSPREHISNHRRLQALEEGKRRDGKVHHRKRKRTKDTTSLPSHSASESAQERSTFEKKARHKPREDKYEPYHGGPARSKPVKDPTGTNTVGPGIKKTGNSRGKKRGTGLTTTKELMGKFQSDAIHNERLTILPSMHAGIFNNSKYGKAPGDLAFGNMAFLKEARPAETTKSASNTRSLESRKKDQKELENIEIFFSHKKHEDHDSSKTKQLGQRELPTTELRGQDSMRSTQGGSSRATSYFSWSSSNQRQHVAGRQAGTSEQLEDSTQKQAYDTRLSSARDKSMTPDRIRQQLLDSGIYRCLMRVEPQLFGTAGLSPTKAHGRDDDGGKPPHPTEKTGAPVSRADIAQQAYIRQPIREPQSPRMVVVLPSKEILTMPEPRPAEAAPMPEVPSQKQDLPMWQDRGPEPEGISKSPLQQHVRSSDTSAILEASLATDTLPYVQQQLPGSAMMHSPGEMQTHRHTPQLPSGHFNHRYGMCEFRPMSSVSPRFPFDISRWQMNTHSDVRSPYQIPMARGSTLHSASVHSGITLQDWNNACSGTTRNQSMREYIADLEQTTLYAGKRDTGRGGYSTLQPGNQVMHAEHVQDPDCGLNRQLPHQGSDMHYDYETRNPLSPASPYGIPGFEPSVYDQEEHSPVEHMAGPRQPDTSMSVDMVDMAMYWKPNTYGL